jgi:surface protein
MSNSFNPCKPVSSQAFALGSIKGSGSSTRIFNFCVQQNPNNFQSCLDQFSIFPPLNRQRIIIPNTDGFFIYQFFNLYSSNQTHTNDEILQNVPITNIDAKITYTTSINVINPITKLTQVLVNYQFFDDGTTRDGLSIYLDDGTANQQKINFYNNLTTPGFTITQFGGIPLSRGTFFSGDVSGAQLQRLQNLVFTASDAPTILTNTICSFCFFNCTNFNSPLNNWDVSNAIDMTLMFGNVSTFNQDISSWNVSNVTDMSDMFFNASAFNQDISSWDVSNAIDMTLMFFNASAFNQDISSWNVSNVTDMTQMFFGATAFNQNISSWNVSNVTNMTLMFLNAVAFNQDISTWNVSNVTNMSSMFANATAFNQDISSWNVSNVTNMSSMFANATAFNQDISVWNVSNVTNMSSMFANATAFNQDITSWDVSNVTTMRLMFSSSVAFNNGGSSLSWGSKVFNVTDFLSMFDRSTSFTNQNVPLNWVLNLSLSVPQPGFNTGSVLTLANTSCSQNSITVFLGF